MIKSRFERFADDYRAVRFGRNRYAYTVNAKSYRRAIGKVHAKLFQNVVNDKRFSLPILFNTLKEYCGDSGMQQFEHIFQRYEPTGHERFPFNND